MNLPHLASRLYGTPLLLARAKLDVILSVLGERVNWPESDLAAPLVPKRPTIDAPAGIAVIPVVGSLVRRTVGLDPASGFTSYAEIAGMVGYDDPAYFTRVFFKETGHAPRAYRKLAQRG